ncbi:hypothetical protein RJ639_011242 [Escallonia herrerae]|uniref:UBC core domain-containing protein n=1 Tax=Escallonia herrerae TaxID=1293975 RepID=A0AA89ARE1_9ASTE|nr:hypothetical protein RJ639_011242 [Escallonia herrerae]
MGSSSVASLILQKELKNISEHAVEEFFAGLVDEDNLFQWRITIMGPPGTLYLEALFDAIMDFNSSLPTRLS